MDCADSIFGQCLVPASGEVGASFFGFAEFVGAFALLAIVFTIASVQYRFRISVAPLPLPKITFWAIGVIGFGTLATDLWVAEGWPVIYVPYMTFGVVQGLFAAGFLAIALAWLYFAFLRPPVFSKWNARRYGQTLFEYLLRGSDAELPVIATEVGRSADQLVESFVQHRHKFKAQREQQDRGEKVKPNPGNYASNVLSMIGNRKFCRHVVSVSPGTAIALFQAAAKRRVYDAPIGQFARNITTEAIQNPDSNLYHEDSRYDSGLFGDLKPFTQAMYGSYMLVEGLGTNYQASPLDVDYRTSLAWTAPQLRAYARAVLTTFADRLEQGLWGEHSYTLYRAMDMFDSGCGDVYKLNGVEDGDPDISERLRVCVQFVKDLVELLEEYEGRITISRKKPKKRGDDRDIYDQVAELMSEIIYNVAGVTKPVWPCWQLQHNTVWDEFFDSFRDSKTRRIIAFKLRRLIYEEIVKFDKYEDLKSFKAARYLGICLNCMGLHIRETRTTRDRDTAALKEAVLRWARRNFRTLHESHPTVAEACLMGSITFDADRNRLVKTYASLADREPSREFLELS